MCSSEMHSMKVIVALSLILAVAVAKAPSERTNLEGDDLVAAKELLTRSLDKLHGPKYNVVNWLSTEGKTVSGTLHKYVVDVSDGSDQNECTFRIWQSLAAIKNANQIHMQCQGGYEQTQYW